MISKMDGWRMKRNWRSTFLRTTNSPTGSKSRLLMKTIRSMLWGRKDIIRKLVSNLPISGSRMQCSNLMDWRRRRGGCLVTVKSIGIIRRPMKKQYCTQVKSCIRQIGKRYESGLNRSFNLTFLIELKCKSKNIISKYSGGMEHLVTKFGLSVEVEYWTYTHKRYCSNQNLKQKRSLQKWFQCNSSDLACYENEITVYELWESKLKSEIIDNNHCFLSYSNSKFVKFVYQNYFKIFLH